MRSWVIVSPSEFALLYVNTKVDRSIDLNVDLATQISDSGLDFGSFDVFKTMSFWFHRNPLKGTTPVGFDLKFQASNAEAVKVCSELRRNREKLIECLSNLDADDNLIETHFNEYLSLIRGFYENADKTGGDTTGLRHSIKYKWTHSTGGSTLISQNDAIYEVVSICEEYAFWLIKRAAATAVKTNDLSEEQMKKIHRDTRRAYGILQEIKSYISYLEERGPTGSDLDTKVIDAYICQCIAEAQEVTIYRAIQMKHSSSLIAALANQTSQKFLEAAIAIKALDITKFGKWMHYFQIKCCCYGALAYSFYGDHLLSLEKCGEAVRCCQEALRRLEVLDPLCKEYSKMKGAGVAPKCETSLFFQRIKAAINRIKEKCERENTLIYHHKPPLDVPKLDLRETHGLVVPDDFKLPPISSLWTPFACAAFEQSVQMLQNMTLKDSKDSKSEKSKSSDKKKDKEKDKEKDKKKDKKSK